MTIARISTPIRLLALLSLLFAVLPAQADQIQYRVAQGDTLIGLGERLLARPGDWTVLQRLNGIADPYRIPVGTRLRIPRELLRAEPRELRVDAVHGQAVSNGAPLVAGETVKAGAQLDTGDDGYVSLRLPDGSTLELPARSSLRVETLHGYPGFEGEDVHLHLNNGRVESTAVPRRGPAARYRIDTPTAVIGVRGTQFRVATEAAAGQSRLEVTRGKVEIRAGKAQRMLDAGFGVVADKRNLGTSRRLPAAPDLDGLPALFEHPVLHLAPPPFNGAVAWRAQVASNEQFLPVLAERAGPGNLRIDGLPDGHYFLRARLIDEDGIEGYGAMRGFELKTRPEPPFPAQPRDGAKAPAGTVQFAWSGAPEATAYRFELLSTEGGGPVVEAVSNTSHSKTLKPGEYQWRVASVRADGERGPWSVSSQVLVRAPASEPEPPEIDDNSLLFRWAGEAGLRFGYEFSTDEHFSTTHYAGEVDQPQIDLPRPPPDTYFMRVRVIEPDGYVGAWSGAQRVIVPASVPWWIFLLPLLTL